MIEIINDSDKTFIGRIEKGFDFLGYHFSPEGLSVAEKTIEKFLARAVRRYEQERDEPCGSPHHLNFNLISVVPPGRYCLVKSNSRTICNILLFSVSATPRSS
jgi:hypothetical protein